MTYYIHYLWKNNNPKCHSGDCWAAGSLSAPLKLCLYHEELTRISVYLLLGCVRVKPLLYNKNRQKRSHRNPDDVRSVCSLDYGWTGFSHPDKIRSGSSLNLVYMGQSISWMMRIWACNGIVFEVCQRPASTMCLLSCLESTLMLTGTLPQWCLCLLRCLEPTSMLPGACLNDAWSASWADKNLPQCCLRPASLLQGICLKAICLIALWDLPQCSLWPASLLSRDPHPPQSYLGPASICLMALWDLP